MSGLRKSVHKKLCHPAFSVQMLFSTIVFSLGLLFFKAVCFPFLCFVEVGEVLVCGFWVRWV